MVAFFGRKETASNKDTADFGERGVPVASVEQGVGEPLEFVSVSVFDAPTNAGGKTGKSVFVHAIWFLVRWFGLGCLALLVPVK